MYTWRVSCSHCGEVAIARLMDGAPIFSVADGHIRQHLGHSVSVMRDDPDE